MAYVYAVCATIFSIGSKFRPVSNFYGVKSSYTSRPFLCVLGSLRVHQFTYQFDQYLELTTSLKFCLLHNEEREQL